MTTIPLTVLVHDGPMARAYLARLRCGGWRPQRAILMVNNRRRGSGKAVGGFLPGPLRRWYGARVNEIRNNYWPRKIASSMPWLVEAIATALRQLGEHAPNLINDIVGRFDYASSAERFERVEIQSLKDPQLGEQLSSDGSRFVLFTGGGIVPETLLSLPKMHFLHVHPGFLPHVRGADGLLWSMLVRGRPGVSCFQMACGIDTGDLVRAEDFPPLRFDISGYERPLDQMLYRAVYSFYDPIMRAELLAQTLASCGGDPGKLAATPQDESSSVTYHFMHESLRRIVLKDLFRS